MLCPLCSSTSINQYAKDRRRLYYQCTRCKLVIADSTSHLSLAAEKAEYDKHENTLDDSGYLNFLSRAYEPLMAQVPAPADGLDFGCGPAPALAHYLKSQNYQMECFDKFYFSDPSPLKQRYDFVTCTEVIEHIADPAVELTKIFSLLKPGGWLVIMTKRVIDQSRFSQWHYKNDPTHICFYSDATFEWMAKFFDMTLNIVGPDVVMLQKLRATDAR